MRRLLIHLAFLSALCSPAVAQDAYPTRAITVVVPFGAGSGSDTVARILGQHLSAALGQPVVIENRGGANGTIAAAFVARAAPDGYTFLIGTNSTHGSNPSLMKQLPYDPIKDFTPTVRVGAFTYFLVGNPALPAKDVAGLVAYGKANQMNLATGNTTSLVMGETFVRGVGMSTVTVPYRSVPQALADLMTGRVSIMFADVSSSISLVRAGSLRAFAITSPERSSLVPELPTLRETVLPGFNIESWIGFFAPAGTPAPVCERIAGEVTRILGMPELQQRLADLGVEPRPISGAAFGAFVQQDIANWTRLVKEAGIEPE